LKKLNRRTHNQRNNK